MCNKKDNKLTTLLSFIYAVFICLLIFTFSISLPIIIRGFYFAHINPLNLPKESGFSKTEIKEAYNEVLDYLTLPNKEFSIGVMKYSPEGKAHFEDCKILFSINFILLIISLVVVLSFLIIGKRNKNRKYMIGKRSASFYSGVVCIFIPVILGGLASLNFDKAFEIFHNIFFPGKENWIFDSYTDEIINVLPQEFFMNCAILIGVSILICSFCLIIKELIKSRS